MWEEDRVMMGCENYLELNINYHKRIEVSSGLFTFTIAREA